MDRDQANADIQETFAGMRETEVRPFQGLLDTHGFVAVTAGLVVLAFRGTFPLSIVNWLTDGNILPRPVNGLMGNIPRGFADAFEFVFPSAKKVLAETLAGRKLWITGHSLGGGRGHPGFRHVR